MHERFPEFGLKSLPRQSAQGAWKYHAGTEMERARNFEISLKPLGGSKISLNWRL